MNRRALPRSWSSDTSSVASCPPFSPSTRRVLISNPTTGYRRANSTARGSPTYPSPMTAILTCCISLSFGFQRAIIYLIAPSGSLPIRFRAGRFVVRRGTEKGGIEDTPKQVEVYNRLSKIAIFRLSPPAAAVFGHAGKFSVAIGRCCRCGSRGGNKRDVLSDYRPKPAGSSNRNSKGFVSTNFAVASPAYSSPPVRVSFFTGAPGARPASFRSTHRIAGARVVSK